LSYWSIGLDEDDRPLNALGISTEMDLAVQILESRTQLRASLLAAD